MIAPKPQERLQWACGFAFGVLLVSGCTASTVPIAPFEAPFLAIDATNASFPVMLSKVPTRDKGRGISASSGSAQAYTHLDFPTYTYTASSRERSEDSASAQILRGPQDGDHWVQIERAEYRMGHGSGYGSVSQGKKLTLEGSVHR